MNPAPTLSREIGQAERAMRALLAPHLAEAGITFAQWTALVFMSRGALERDQVVALQLKGHVADEDEAHAAVAALEEDGFAAATDGDRVELAARGRETFNRIHSATSEITEALWGDLPAPDPQATQRTLAEIARRANERLTTG